MTVRIGVVAPGNRIEPALATDVSALAFDLYGKRVTLRFHPQCYLSAGHFAGSDEERARAFLDYANDESLDAIWIARGGYGSARIAAAVCAGLGEAARRKAYLGYSDAGALLGALYSRGFSHVFHGPMPADLLRNNGSEAVKRAISFLVERDAGALEPSVTRDTVTAAFNMTILSHMIGTPFQPLLDGHVLMLEEVAEHMYRIDRTMQHITTADGFARLAGLRLGRCSAIPDNDPVFDGNEEDVARLWCERAKIPYLGRADIGHDIANKIVPFGRLSP